MSRISNPAGHEESVPALHATVSANFLSRGQERLSAPRPPGTILQGQGRDAELVARWDRNDLALSPVAKDGVGGPRPGGLTLSLTDSRGTEVRGWSFLAKLGTEVRGKLASLN